ncbi:hypothetical protein MNR01_13620 [Lysobacter sp. S4-A87]|uniref:hypothetical protein n=1 Tax=Lysobacter sp. S4-A87 TaxID=2925843 RepID=UPI001F52E989|nr:hypothetical protein [Lysobacter sp. S4-A87]UNK48771.1 hypothetical protein MNR01_13620 [Lysobacter sp. S4-A87]
MDILIAALHAAVEYRFWVTVLLMGAVTAVAVLLQPQGVWLPATALVALLVLANLFFGHRLASAPSPPPRNDAPPPQPGLESVAACNAGASTGGRVIAGTPRQVDTAR